MAWTAPTTRATNDLISAANWNTDLVDNLSWLGTSRPHAMVYKSGNTSIANTTYTIGTYDSEYFDTGACHSTSVNTGRLTVPTGGGGLYEIFALWVWASNATGIRYSEFYLNGTTGFSVTVPGTVNGTITCNAMYTQRVLTAGDYVETRGYQSSGGALNHTGTATYSFFGFGWIGSA